MSYIYNLTDTWNAAGTTFAGIKMAVTNTASGASSKLLDLSVSGATTGAFSVDKSGNASISGTLTLGTALSAANGGTGLTSLTADYIPYGNGTGAFASSANFAWISANNQLQIAAGTFALPALFSVGDTNTGIFFPAADTVAISTGGTEKFRVESSGAVSIGGTASVGNSLYLGKNITGSTFSSSVVNVGVVQSDVTARADYFYSYATTAAAAFTLGTLNHFFAFQGPIGGATVTNQIGFNATSSLTGATNNYGFYGNLDAATGRWNFYAAGTASNHFAGSVLVGTTTAGASKLVVNDNSIQINTAKTPASATAVGVTGQVCWDSSYIYVCTATNTWKRAAIATW